MQNFNEIYPMAKINAVVVIENRVRPAQLAIYYKVAMDGHGQGLRVTADQVLLQLVADRPITHNLVCKKRNGLRLVPPLANVNAYIQYTPPLSVCSASSTSFVIDKCLFNG